MKKLFTAIQRMLDGLSSRRSLVGVSCSSSESFAVPTVKRNRRTAECPVDSQGISASREFAERTQNSLKPRRPRDDREMTERQNATARVYQGYSKGIRFAATILVLLFIGAGSAWGAIADGTYVLCTSTNDLEAGAHYIIASGTSGSVYCISNVSQGNYREIVSATVSSSKITVASNSTIMTLTLGGTTGAWTFYTDNYAGTAGYLASAASGSNNYCRVISTSTTGTISFSSNAAVITLNPHDTRNILRYNSNNTRFACYSSGQAAVYLYKKVSGYSITYHCNDATSDCPSNASGQTALPSTLPTPTRTGCSFGGWYTNSGLTTPAVAGATLAADADLYAKWTCNVTLNRNGATETINNVVVGTALDDIDGTSAQGGCSEWTFEGWSKTQRAAQNNSATMTLVTEVDGSGPYYAVYSHTESGSGTVTFTPGTDTGSTSVTKSGITCTMTTMDNSSYYQIYANASGTFSISSGSITAINFTCTESGTSKYGPGNASANVGSYSYSGTSGTWTGSASSVTLSSTVQIRMSALSISYFGSTTYYSTTASCCTALGSINGSVALTNEGCSAGELKATWKMEATTGIASQTLKVYDEDLNEVTAKRITNITPSTSNHTETISGLTPCAEYYVAVENVKADGSYCEPQAPWESDVVATLGYTYSISKSGVSLKAGETEAANSCDDFGAIYVANSGYDLPATITVTNAGAEGTGWFWDDSDGSLMIDKAYVTGNVSITITPTVHTYTITYYDGDAENASKAFSGEHEDGYPTTHTYATSTTLKSATKDGFNFGGWYDNKECEGDPITSLGATSYTADIVLYAKWIDDSKWTVTIGSHANGSLSVTYTGMESALTSGSREIEKNTVLTISATPNTGYTLTNLTVGDDDDFTSGGTHTLTGNITVSATFSAINYTITYNLNGGVNNGDNVASYTIEDEVLFEAPTKTGYHFDGWFTDAEFDPESEIMWIDEGSTGNVVVYAKWSANSYDVTLKPNGGTGSDQVVSATYDAAMPITVKTAGTDIVIPTREGYTFTGWWDATSGGNKYYKADGTSARTWNVAEATNLYAQWSINEYNVAVSAVGDVTISATSPSIAEGGNADVNYGSIVTLSYSGVTSGMYWGGWKVYKSDDESTTVTVTNNSFTMPAYNVVVSAILFSDLLAWCDPDVSVTGDIHLTSYKDIYVNSTSGAGNLIEISSSDMGSATRMEVAYLDAEDNEVDKAESVFRLCNNGTTDYNVNDEAIALDYEWSSTHSVRYTPNAYDQRDNYKLQLTFKKGEQVLKTVEHNLYGRALPEEFVLAVKNTSNNHWYALPNTMGDNSDAQTAITPTRIFVDDPTTPTKATFASESTIYKGKARNTATGNVNGIRLSPDGTKILRIISGKNFLYLPSANSDANQVWYLKSTDFDAYEIAQDPSQNPSKKLGLYNNSGVYFGYATTPFSYNIYLLPIDDNGKYADLALTDIDWTDDDFGFTATTSATKAAVQIEDGTRTTLVDLHSEGNVHAANLNTKVDFTNKEGQNVLLTLYDNNCDILEGAQVTIPSIVTTTATAWGSIATEPTLDNIVVLKGDMVVSQKDAAAKSIVLDGGKLEIAAGAALVMDGNVKKFDGELFRQTAFGDVALRSTKAAGTGALIMNPATVTVAPQATVEQATKTGKINGQKINQYIGTPFSDGNGYSNWYGSYVYYLDAENNRWVNLKSNNAALDAFKGYMIMRDDETTFWMQGTLVKPTDANTVLTLTPRDDVRQSNLLANSWSGPIDIEAMETTDFEGADATIYLFNAGTKAQNGDAGAEANSAGQWTTLPVASVKGSPGDFPITVIPSMQGFIVLAHSGEGTHTVTLNYDRMVYQPAKSSGADIQPNRAPEMRQTAADSPEVLKLIVSGESGASDNVLLFVREDFTTGFDNGWDGRKMTGSAWAPKMYAVSDDGNMAIHAVPEAEGTVIGFRAGQDNNYTFTFRYEGNDVLYLNDMLTETSTRIHEGFSYDFTTADGDIETRFVISHTPFVKTTPTGMDNVQGDEGQSVRKLFYQGVMYIIRGGKIYNASGERVK